MASKHAVAARSKPKPSLQHLSLAAEKAAAAALAAKHAVRAAKSELKKARKQSKTAKKVAKLALKRAEAAKAASDIKPRSAGAGRAAAPASKSRAKAPRSAAEVAKAVISRMSTVRYRTSSGKPAAAGVPTPGVQGVSADETKVPAGDAFVVRGPADGASAAVVA